MFVAGLAVLLLGSLTEGAPTGNIATGCVMMQHNDGKEIGVVRFEAAPDGTMVSFSANMESDIIKVGKHGFHVHQDPVQGVDCVSTGGHYNPTGKNHGSLYGTPGDLYERHVGDLGNILAGDGGIQETVSLAVGSGWEAPFTLEGEYSIIGHSVVLHADQDDLGLGNFDDSKTTGHAGSRLACCTLV